MGKIIETTRENNMQEVKKKNWFKFSSKRAFGIFIYYSILFSFSMFFAITGILNESFLTKLTITQKSIISGASFAVLGAVIFYSKKIYKACINLDFDIAKSEEDKIREFGITVYFILRPLFSIIFSLLLIISLKLGCKIVTINETILNQGFLYISSFLSFFVGYSSGDVLDIFGDNSKTLMNKIFNKNLL